MTDEYAAVFQIVTQWNILVNRPLSTLTVSRIHMQAILAALAALDARVTELEAEEEE